MLNDLEHLPKIVTDTNGINDVLLAIDPEIVMVNTKIDDTLKELFIKTATDTISIWEDDFGLSYDSSLTLNQRRLRVLEKLTKKGTLTWDRVEEIIKKYLIHQQFYIINDSSNYAFKIFLVDADTDGLAKELTSTKPAYITFTIQKVDEYVRYCGTFYSGTNPL